MNGFSLVDFSTIYILILCLIIVVLAIYLYHVCIISVRSDENSGGKIDQFSIVYVDNCSLHNKNVKDMK